MFDVVAAVFRQKLISSQNGRQGQSSIFKLKYGVQCVENYRILPSSESRVGSSLKRSNSWIRIVGASLGFKTSNITLRRHKKKKKNNFLIGNTGDDFASGKVLQRNFYGWRIAAKKSCLQNFDRIQINTNKCVNKN